MQNILDASSGIAIECSQRTGEEMAQDAGVLLPVRVRRQTNSLGTGYGLKIPEASKLVGLLRRCPGNNTTYITLSSIMEERKAINGIKINGLSRSKAALQ